MDDAQGHVLDNRALEELLYRLLRSLYLFERLEVEQFGLSFQQIYCLKYLRRTSPVRFPEIGRELRLQPFAVTRLLDGLQDRGLVSREAGDEDRRSRTVEITGQGLELVSRIEENARELALQNLSDMSEDDMRAVVRVIDRLETILPSADAPDNRRKEA